MSLGRIKRDRAKIERMVKVRAKKVRVHVEVYRYAGHRGSVGYRALACFGTTVGNNMGGRHLNNVLARCVWSKTGRTPQSAIAKALKGLSRKAATRGRGDRRRDR